MSQTTNAGIVTAYGAAVRGGYEGTYDQFCADLAQLATVLAQLTNMSAVAETLAAGSSATASYEDGVLTLGIPRGDTGNGIQSISLISTVGLVKTYRITFTDEDHFDFDVVDGNGIASATLNQDYTLTLTFDDGTTWTSTSIRGATGATPTLTIGTVTTGAPGSSAAAEITGTPEDPVLNLTIPQGDPGEVPADAIASTQASTTASKKLAVGEYFWLSGSLYIVTTEIASGGTIVTSGSGANCKLAKVADDVGELKSSIDTIEGTLLPQTVEATEALTYYPFTPLVGDTVVVKSKNGASYARTWAVLFYAADKSTLLQQADVSATATTKEIVITASGIAYVRPNVNFSGDAYISVMSGSSLVEKVDANTADIASNTNAIAENTQAIEDIKNGKNNLYDGISLILGRVYNGVYSDAITTVHCTDYLPIIGGRTYAVYGGYINANYSNYYDKNKVYKGALPLDGLNTDYPYGSSYNFLLFTAPQDAAYTRINFMNSDLIDGTDIRPQWFFRDVTDAVWAKKNVLVIGDSISTDVYGDYKKWVTDLQDEGFFTKGLTTNSSQHATGFVATYSGQANTTFIARLTALGDLTGFDAIITFGGINDWIQSVDFDDFKSAVDTYFAYLIENATQARIIVLLPLHTALYGTTNSAGKTQKDYDDYIKSVAKDYAFPCLNLTDESGFCPDKSQTFSDMWTLLPTGFTDYDGVHPIAEWEKNFLAPMIKGFLSSIG